VRRVPTGTKESQIARIDEDPEHRYEEPITFQQLLVCEDCGADFDHTFVTDLVDVEQLTDPPEDDVKCPGCGHEFHAVYSGWFNYGDAG
jgi:DNA-directed RNA polymerase subunit RPC12/RpoP